MRSNNYFISLVFDIYILRFVFKIGISRSFWGILLGDPFGLNLRFGAPFLEARGVDLGLFLLLCWGLGAKGGQQQLKDTNHDG